MWLLIGQLAHCIQLIILCVCYFSTPVHLAAHHNSLADSADSADSTTNKSSHILYLTSLLSFSHSSITSTWSSCSTVLLMSTPHYTRRHHQTLKGAPGFPCIGSQHDRRRANLASGPSSKTKSSIQHGGLRCTSLATECFTGRLVATCTCNSTAQL